MFSKLHAPTQALGLALALASLSAVSCGPTQRTGPSVIDADAPTEFTVTESGLKYRILRKSDGQRPTANNQVTVDYAGWLDDGSIFDSSYDRSQPATFGLRSVIAGWSEGMQLIGKGGMIELEIPSELGYGEAGSPPKIPPDSTLHFKIELLDVK
ncbi:MAG: FKBP-type peptidyl-prolyl cis-trans isomerase [Planctomycetota bacterium]|nr:FKBP-type peptidyl-prolyl cis-trans isomerase [Planctomycetota bacterium]